MKTVVIYNSQTGFTKRYAQWIAEGANADCFELSQAKKQSLDDYDAIVFGGWAFAGNVSKLSWFKANMDNWAHKRLVVFCVGASPAENPEIDEALGKLFGPAEQERVKVFYCPGGLNYEGMPAASRVMMKMFVSAHKTKKNKTEQDEAMIKLLSASYDISDRKYIEPILKYLE